jgi:hypothetical protein
VRRDGTLRHLDHRALQAVILAWIVALAGDPIEEVRAKQEGDSSIMTGVLAAVVKTCPAT